MNNVDDIYRVYALRYALMDGTRSRRELFPGLDPSEEGPASIAYYVWLAINDAPHGADRCGDVARGRRAQRASLSFLAEGRAGDARRRRRVPSTIWC